VTASPGAPPDGETGSALAEPAGAPQPAPRVPVARRLERLLSTRKGLALLYLIFAGAYLGASGGRLRQHSQYNHYVYLADGWLHVRLALAGPPPNENDWAKVDVLVLRDHRTVKGTYGGRGGPADRFYPLRGKSETISDSGTVSDWPRSG